MFEPRIIPPDEARAILADHVQLETSEQPHRCVGGHVWPCAMYRLAHTAAVLGEQREAVLALHRGHHWCPDGLGGSKVFYPNINPCPTGRALLTGQEKTLAERFEGITERPPLHRRTPTGQETDHAR